MAQKILDRLKERFGEKVLKTESQRGDEIAEVTPAALFEVVRYLKEDPEMQMNLLVDLTVVDWPQEEPRFEVVYHFYSIGKRHRLRLKTRVGTYDQEPEVDSLTPLYKTADWWEREAFDLYGVRFKNYVDSLGRNELRRILMYEGFEGHPLRKDYPINKRQPLIGPKN
jgi:NADH-quinone oxidoreductase subunit C